MTMSMTDPPCNCRSCRAPKLQPERDHDVTIVYEDETSLCVNCGAKTHFTNECHREPKPAPPEVPAPDEVFVWVAPSGFAGDFRPVDKLRGEGTVFDEPASRGYVGYTLVRYVRAREGGR